MKENTSRENDELMGWLFDAMRKEKNRTGTGGDIYEMSLEKYKEFKSDKEKERKAKEMSELKTKLDKMEIENKKIPKLEKRITRLETELSDLRNLLKQMVSYIYHII